MGRLAAALAVLSLSGFAAPARAQTAGPFLEPGAADALSSIRFSAARLRAQATARVEESSALTLWRGHETQPVVSPELPVAPFDRAVISWNTTGPATIELEVEGRWRVMGRWGPEPRSVPAPGVETDTLVLARPAASLRFRVTPENGAAVTLVAVAHWMHGEKRPLTHGPSSAWGRVLDVPQRSQANGQPNAGDICSPTSLSMVLQYYGVDKPTEEVASGVFDHQANIYGNWPFNTAYAHAVSGLEAYVVRMSGLDELEGEIAAGRPVIISHRWQSGDLDNAPVSAVDGHLIVVVGFTKKGDVVVNDPAGRRGNGGVRRVYKRAQLYKTWLTRASGVAYVLRRPADPR